MHLFKKKLSYGGLDNNDCQEKESKIVIIPAPFESTTTYQKGTRKGPKAILEASAHMELYDIETDFEVYKKGIYTTSPIKGKNPRRFQKKLYNEVIKYLKQDKFVVTLGGEHSLSVAPAKAHAQIKGPLSVLQLDAHSDLRPSYQKSPYNHACAMSRIQEISNVTKTVAVGIRSMDKEELLYMEKENTIFFDPTPPVNWIEKTIEKLTDNVYITLDIDVFSPSIMNATGTPEPGGLLWEEALILLKKIAQEKNIVGFDVVELRPLPYDKAPNFLASKLIYKLLSYIFSQRNI